jgi:hypothetical protein
VSWRDTALLEGFRAAPLSLHCIRRPRLRIREARLKTHGGAAADAKNVHLKGSGQKLCFFAPFKKNVTAMRFFPLAFLLLVVAACSSPAEPVATAPSAPAVVPTDQQMTGEAAIDSIRAAANRIESRFQAGMLQQKNVAYVCDKIRGLVELYTDNGATVLARGKYTDGDTRTVIDNTYFKDGEPFYHYSETNTWELDGTMRTLSNNSEVPGVRNTTAQYRYYVDNGAVLKFLKRKYDHYTYALDNPNPDTLPLEEMPSGGELPFRYGLAKSALETGAVDCAFFQ